VIECTFGVLYEKTLDILEVGLRLRAHTSPSRRRLPDHPLSFQAAEVGGVLDTARNQGIVAYKGDALNPRKHFMTIISLLQENVKDSDENTCKPGDVGGTADRWSIAIVSVPNPRAHPASLLFFLRHLCRDPATLCPTAMICTAVLSPTGRPRLRWRPSL
jgi:hypothetical protein